MHNRGQKNPILVIEDEAPIREGLLDVLVFHGYQPTGAATGPDGLQAALTGQWDLILLDVMLPGIDGFEICKRLRANAVHTPIIMLTAKGAEEDIIRGFSSGCDDYVHKPFSIKELIARVSALLRRAGSFHRDHGASFTFGTWEIDAGQLKAHNGKKAVTLTRREVDILSLLEEEGGRIVSRRRLLRDVWKIPHPDRVHTRTVDMHIAKLRKKLEKPGAPVIKTIRGEGYSYAGGISR